MPYRIRRLLFIVGSNRQDFYNSLRRTFKGDDTVQVVLDRRLGERRRRAGPRKRTREQRQADRRARQEIERQVRARGYAVVGVLALARAPVDRKR